LYARGSILERIAAIQCVIIFIYESGAHRDLHSFPTRRSSDLAVSTSMILSFRDQLSRAVEVLPKYKVIIYIDGFNLYFGIRQEAIKRRSKDEPDPRWYRYMWLDLHAMCSRMLTNRQELIAIKYFTAPIIGSEPKRERQNAFL